MAALDDCEFQPEYAWIGTRSGKHFIYFGNPK